MTGTSHTTTYSYTDSPSGDNAAGNSNAYPTQITDPLGHVQAFTYNYTTGELATFTDPNSKVTSYTYVDPLNRLTGTTFPDGGATNISYQDAVPSFTTTRLLNSSGSPSPEVRVATLDGMGHVIQTELSTDPSGADVVVTSYDGEGRVHTKTNPYRSTANGTAAYYYDALGRPIEELEEDGTSELQWSYNGSCSVPAVANCNTAHLGSVATGNWIDFTDEAGNHWQRSTDSFGNLVGVMEPNGSSTAPTMETDYGYNTLNDLASVTQWGGTNGSSGARLRSFTYDSLGRLGSSTNPESGVVSYTYDANSNLASKTDARNIATQYTYDSDNRLTAETATGISYVYTYDSGTNGVGRLTAASNLVNADEVFSYDSMGRIISQASWTPSSPNNTSIVTTAKYDLAGNLTDLTYPDGRHITQQFDGAAHLTDVVFADWNGTSVNYPYASSISYSPSGSVSQMTLGDGVIQTFSLNTRLQDCEIKLDVSCDARKFDDAIVLR